MLFSNQQISLGLDISDRSIKAVQLKRNIKGKLELQALSQLDLPPTIFEEGEIKDSDGLTQFIIKLITKPQIGSFNTSYVTACLPETKTFIKVIDIPPMPEKEIHNAVKWEAEHHIPIPIEDTYWDWQKIDTPAKNNARLPVLLAVVPKNIVDTYTAAINNAKLTPLALEVEAVPIARSLLPYSNSNPKNTATMIIDMGATRTSLIVVDLNSIQFTVSLPISGRRVTETIARSLKLSEEQAEKAKIICGLDPKKSHGAIGEILHQTIDDLINRIRESIIFYREHFPEGNKIGEILLCGGGSNFKLIDKHLSSSLELPVKKGDPWLNLKPSPPPLKNNELISYTTALGLALRTSLNSSDYSL